MALCQFGFVYLVDAFYLLLCCSRRTSSRDVEVTSLQACLFIGNCSQSQTGSFYSCFSLFSSSLPLFLLFFLSPLSSFPPCLLFS